MIGFETFYFVTLMVFNIAVFQELTWGEKLSNDVESGIERLSIWLIRYIVLTSSCAPGVSSIVSPMRTNHHTSGGHKTRAVLIWYTAVIESFLF